MAGLRTATKTGFRRLTGDRVEETHEDWEQNRRKLCGRINKKNVVARKVPVGAKQCRTSARAEYVTWKLNAFRTTAALKRRPITMRSLRNPGGIDGAGALLRPIFSS
jgi:hypothetical protein